MTVLVARDDAGLIIGTVAGAAMTEGHIRGMAVARHGRALGLPMSCWTGLKRDERVTLLHGNLFNY